MRKVAIVLFVTVFANSLMFAQDSDRNVCGDYLRTKKLIDSTVYAIILDHSNEPNFIAKFKKAQQAWESYRDAQIEMLFPEVNKQKEYGSLYPTCRCSWLLQMANQRVDFLLQWSSNTNNEDDPCNGSMNSAKRKSHIKFNV